MDLHPATAAVIASLSSVCVGMILIGIRRAIAHREQTTRHTTEIAVLGVKLASVDAQVQRNGDALERIESKIDSLGDRQCCGDCPAREAS